MSRDWESVSKGTEISLGKFVSEYFTPLTLGSQTGVVSTEDTDEIWKAPKEEAMEKVKGMTNRPARADSPMIDSGKVLLAQQARRMGDKQENSSTPLS